MRLTPTLFAFLVFCYPLALLADTTPCGISLKSIQPSFGTTGSVVELFGNWGKEQGNKVAVINRGGSNRLEIQNWSPKVLQVRVPANLSPGEYKVGVYCQDLSTGSSYSSGFASFVVTSTGAGTTTTNTRASERKDPRLSTVSDEAESQKEIESNISLWWLALLLPVILFWPKSKRESAVAKSLRNRNQQD